MGFFTSVAAFGVLGSQTLLLTGRLTFAVVLWCVTSVGWIGLIYGLFTKETRPTIAAIPKVFVKVVLASFIAVVVGTILMMLTTDSFAVAVTGQMILALGMGFASAAIFGCIAKISKIRPDKLDKMKGRI